MHFPRKLILAGTLLSLIPIGLGIAALVTPNWIEVTDSSSSNSTCNSGTYSLLMCSDTDTGKKCPSRTLLTAAKGLEIAGVASIFVGIILALFLDIVLRNRYISLLPQLFLIAGPISIFIGLILYALGLAQHLAGCPPAYKITLGYSIILMIISCILGFLTAIYYAFANGFGWRHGHVIRSSPLVVIQQTERF